jgi:uncharacterized protein (TIGR00369 family)
MTPRSHTPRDPDFARRCQESCANQPAMSRLFGGKMVSIEPGFCEIHIASRPDFLQQLGNFHGGIVGALADSAAGYSALSLLESGLEVVTVEYKISFLAPAFGEYLVGRGEVLRSGRTLHFCSADIFAVQNGVEKPVAQMTTTMMAVPDHKK